MSQDRKVDGFTIIELMLSMTFISLLLFAIALTTIQISNIYTKGLTLREVNQSGRYLSDELRRSISSSSMFDVTPAVDESPATESSKYIVRDGGGRLCIGNYSYVWNYGSAIEGGAGAPNIFNKYDDNSIVRFAKVTDPGSSLCSNPSQSVPKQKSTEMLMAGDRSLAMHSFNIQQLAMSDVTMQAMYAITFSIGTNDNQALTTNSSSCRPPSQIDGDENYCSVNKFEIIVRAGNKMGGK